MKNAAVPLLLCLLVAGALVWALSGPSTGTGIDRADPTGTGGTGGDQTGRTGQVDRTRTRIGPDGDQSPGDGRGRTPVADRRLTVRGRVLDAASGAPLAGCEIEIAAVRRQFGQSAAADEPAAEAQRILTGGDGRFEVPIAVPGRHQVRVHTRMQLRADMQGYLWPGRSAELDAGDIRVPTGARISATVVDKLGALQPHIGFRLHSTQANRRDRIAPLNWLEVRSDLAGLFETPVAVASGRWNVLPLNDVQLLEPKAALTVPEHEVLVQTRLVVELPDPKGLITGRVLDDRGEPIPRIAVQAYDGGQFPAGYGETDARGAFQVKCRTEPGKPVNLSVPRARGFDPLTTTAAYPWGSTNVTLTLVRSGNLRLKVLTRDDNAPVEKYRASFFLANAQGTWQSAGEVRGGDHPDGEATVEALPSGRLRVIVEPTDKSAAPNEPLEFIKAPGSTELTVQLQRCVDVPIRIVDQRRQPVANTRVELVRSTDGKAVTLNSMVVRFSQFGRFDRSVSQAVHLDQARTGADGRAVLRWHPTDALLALRVLGPGHVPTVHAPVAVRASNEPIEITVDRGTTLRGRLLPLEVLQALTGKPDERSRRMMRPNINLTYRGKELAGTHGTKSATADENGRFEVAGLAPGQWAVSARIWYVGPGRGNNMAHKEFPPVTITGADTQELELDIKDLRPATLRGRVLLNNAPYGEQRIQLSRINGDGDRRPIMGRALPLQTAADGSFVAASIQAGRYTVSMTTPRDGPLTSMRLTSKDTIEVLPGQDANGVFHIETGRIRVRLVDHESKPVVDQWLLIRSATGGFQSSGRTGADGWLDVHPISVGTYVIGIYPKPEFRPGRLRAPGRAEWQEIGRVTVLPGEAAAPVTLQLPER